RWRFRSLRHAQQPDASTFGVIEQRIFAARGCATSTCHGADAPSGLDLRAGIGYDQLVGVAASNAAAHVAGTLRGVAGDPTKSFLSKKLHGTLGPDEGQRMPLGRDALPQSEIDLVDAWIAAGAPRTGVVDDAPPPPPPSGYQPTEPLAPPPGGFQ